MTNKQRIFIAEYLQCFNATEAARRAGYAFPNKQGPNLLVNIGIKAEIERQIAEKTMTADEVLLRLGKMARGSIEDFIDIMPNGHTAIVNLEKAQALRQLGLIKKFKVTDKGGIEVELYDAQAALKQIRDMVGMDAAKKIEHSGEMSIEYVNNWREQN